MDDSSYQNLAIGILYDAVKDFVYGNPEKHGDACEFLQSPWGRFLFAALDIDTDAAFQALNDGRKEFVIFARRSLLGDKSAQKDFEAWFQERFRYRPPAL
ncbi:MAG: hypothetical protein ACYTDW_15135 [Planctomycetota bacterium]|jgi:hypothetical protein